MSKRIKSLFIKSRNYFNYLGILIGIIGVLAKGSEELVMISTLFIFVCINSLNYEEQEGEE